MKKTIISTEIDSTASTVGEEKAIEMIAKAGFDAWDFSMFGNIAKWSWRTNLVTPADHPLATDNYLAYVRKLKKIGEDNGIFCNQSHAPFPTAPQGIKDVLKRSIECTAEAGGKICVIHPENNKSPEENAEMYINLLPFAKSMGVKIATENMWNWNRELDQAAPAACSDHDNFLAHIKAVNDDYLVACLDIGHAEMRGLNTDLVKMIRTLGSSLQALHIHDNNKHKDNHTLPGLMDIDFDAMVTELKKIDYKGEFTLECNGFIKSQPDLEVALKTAADTVRALADKFDALN